MTEPQPPSPTEFLASEAGEAMPRLAFRRRDGRGPRLVWLGGYGSDMAGTKAEALDTFAADRGQAFLRLDYAGHGESEGAFRDGTISSWTRDAARVLAAVSTPDEPVVLVGSSMGAWIALRLALGRAGPAPNLAGLLLIAPAPDFTARLLEPKLTPKERADLAAQGFFAVPSPYGPEPTIYTARLIEDGRDAAVMTQPIKVGAPVRVLQGMEDPDVPFAHALALVELMPFDDVVTTLIRDGDHRLSRPQDIDRMLRAAEELSAQAASV
ncbi:alpha/beta hydrolase [Antarcticirhabdus aurantiaca]|uniref:Alpha/beta hydrolase n=1 Tax=Antarcticirhabdus aurantiaca TaxID=2606717 RepID=A0ACD4NKA7_9HYPH|nr:alpha/beta hydrolase [Antarcticirhabdus aurantiaca]WAJ27221.1 alpha/beta hydrolase [Jeongeuplla avenae]